MERRVDYVGIALVELLADVVAFSGRGRGWPSGSTSQQAGVETGVCLLDVLHATLALQAGRAAVQILVLPLALASRNPSVGVVVIPTPNETATSSGGVRKEPDRRWLQYGDKCWAASAPAATSARPSSPT